MAEKAPVIGSEAGMSLYFREAWCYHEEKMVKHLRLRGRHICQSCFEFNPGDHPAERIVNENHRRASLEHIKPRASRPYTRHTSSQRKTTVKGRSSNLIKYRRSRFTWT